MWEAEAGGFGACFIPFPVFFWRFWPQAHGRKTCQARPPGLWQRRQQQHLGGASRRSRSRAWAPPHGSQPTGPPPLSPTPCSPTQRARLLEANFLSSYVDRAMERISKTVTEQVGGSTPKKPAGALEGAGSGSSTGSARPPTAPKQA